jgi:hypothetical protein
MSVKRAKLVILAVSILAVPLLMTRPLSLFFGFGIVSRRDDQADSCVWLSVYS